MKNLSKCRRIDSDQALSLTNGARATGDQLAWAIFETNDAAPAAFIARPFLVDDGESPMPVYLAAATLDELHAMLPPGLTAIENHESDFMEVWMVP